MWMVCSMVCIPCLSEVYTLYLEITFRIRNQKEKIMIFVVLVRVRELISTANLRWLGIKFFDKCIVSNLPRIVEHRRLIISRNVSDRNISENVTTILQFVTAASIPKDLLHRSIYASDCSLIVRQFVAPNPRF